MYSISYCTNTGPLHSYYLGDLCYQHGILVQLLFIKAYDVLVVTLENKIVHRLFNGYFVCLRKPLHSVCQ